MSRGINVKVATPKIIKALETSLAKMKKDFAEQDKKQAAFEKAKETWVKKGAKILIENAKLANDTDLSVWHTQANLTIRFDLENEKIKDLLGECPVQEPNRISEWQYKEAVEEIENAIRLLKLTDEEFVSTSTYKSVAKYI